MAEWPIAIITALNNGSGTSWAILISATAAFVAVFVAGHLNRKTQRLVLTFQNQASLIWDEDYLKFRAIFIAKRDSDNGTITALAQKESQANEDAAAVRTIMNDYELIAIGIRDGILDEAFLLAFNRKTAIMDFDKMKPYIDEMRRVQSNDAIYAEFEKMVGRWRGKPENSPKTPWNRFGR
jgi:hypothetical protein